MAEAQVKRDARQLAGDLLLAGVLLLGALLWAWMRWVR